MLLITGLLLCACDPQLQMSGEPTTKATVEGCSEAVKRLKTCCPAYDSYISCTFASGILESIDLSQSASHCLAGKSCSDIEKAVTSEKRLCDVAFRSKHCR